MKNIRRSEDRGFADHGWLKSRHTFSFGEYHDPNNIGFGPLRVINEDRIAGGSGFGTHPHRDMEIISYVMTGGLEHEDSMGNKTVIRPGEVQRMSAGTGIRHSEYNHLPDTETHFFQIWIHPRHKANEPGYGQKSFERELQTRKMVLVVSQNAREGSIAIDQDADVYLSRLAEGDQVPFAVKAGRGVWIQVLRGKARIDGQDLETGDAFSSTDEGVLEISAGARSELMIFDLGTAP